MKRLFMGVAVVALAVWVASAGGCDTPGQVGREITGKDGAPMVLVSAGEFLYGDANQRMSLPAFYLDKYEVTTKLYAKFLQATGRKEPLRWHEVSQVGDGDRPVIGVLWDDADAYCRHYGKRLPTEQEWEKAARGTDGRRYPWGNEEPTSRHAHFNKCCQWNGYGTLATVGSYEAGKSPYGIYDLAGNAWEWTSSVYSSTNNYSYRVIRGGSWLNEASYLRSTYRTWGPPRAKLHPYFFGFRCAQDAR
jgi:formylglycine-generating enzyme required for sulfatase activity